MAASPHHIPRGPAPGKTQTPVLPLPVGTCLEFVAMPAELVTPVLSPIVAQAGDFLMP